MPGPTSRITTEEKAKVFELRNQGLTQKAIAQGLDRSQTTNGIRKRYFIPTETCEMCNRPGVKLDYHHWDSSHLEWGLWLCSRCHQVAEAAEGGVSTNRYLDLKKQVEEKGGE